MVRNLLFHHFTLKSKMIQKTSRAVVKNTLRAKIHFKRLQTKVRFRAPIDNRYTFKYSEGITLVK